MTGRRGRRREPDGRALWDALKTLSANVRCAIVVGLAVLLAYALSGASTAVLAAGVLIAGAVVVLLYRRRPQERTPTRQRLAAIGAGRAQHDADAYAADGEGEAVYEAVLQHLMGLVGSEIEVQVGVATGSSPLATLSGVLWAAADLEWRGDEVLFFAVGEIVNGFYVSREQFVRAEAHANHSDDGTLELVDVDGGTLRIRDTALDNE